MKNILFFFLLFGFIGCSKFGMISKKIDRYSKARKPIKSSHEIRLKLYKEGYLNFIDLKNDTLIFAQSGQIDALIYNGIIHGTKGKVCYKFNDYENKIEINQNDCNLNPLVQKWDTLGIKKMKIEQEKHIRAKVYFKRIIIKNGKIVENNEVEFMQVET